LTPREGIDWADIDWVDNAECLDLIEKVGLCVRVVGVCEWVSECVPKVWTHKC